MTDGARDPDLEGRLARALRREAESFEPTHPTVAANRMLAGAAAAAMGGALRPRAVRPGWQPMSHHRLAVGGAALAVLAVGLAALGLVGHSPAPGPAGSVASGSRPGGQAAAGPTGFAARAPGQAADKANAPMVPAPAGGGGGGGAGGGGGSTAAGSTAAGSGAAGVPAPGPTTAAAGGRGGGAAPHRASPTTVVITAADEGRTFTIRVGQTVVLELSSPSSRWGPPRSGNAAVLAPSSVPVTAAGSVHARFLARSAGRAQVTATQGPLCQSGQPCPDYVRLWMVTVDVSGS